MKAVCAVALSAVACLAQASQLYDGFPHPKWTTRVSPAVHVFEHAGRLRMDFHKAVKGDVFSGSYFSTCRLTGDFDVTADFILPAFPAGNGVRVGLMLNTSPRNGVGFDSSWAAMEVLSQTDGTTAYGADFSNYGAEGAMTTTGDWQGKLRLVRSGGRLTGYYWDAVHASWVSALTTATYTTAPVHFGLTAWSHESYFGGMKTRTAFDNARIESGTCVLGGDEGDEDSPK